MDARVVEAGRAKHRFTFKGGVEHLYLPNQREWPASAFLGGWSLFWAWSGGRAVIEHLDDAMTPVWLAVWLLPLAGAIILLLSQLLGVDVVRVHEGELTITRRAGPFARTWRYGIANISNLRTDMSKWTDEDADGAQWFPFVKQQWGTVRFDYGVETIHLAPHVVTFEAEQIADWLRQRLPASASC